MRALIVLPLLLVLALTACSTSDNGALRLVDTKSPVQLLRNEAWLRIPAVMVKDDQETTDDSLACDESGNSRSWRSSTTALINNSFAARVDSMATNLVDSFVEQGWVAAGEGELRTLTKKGSFAAIEVQAIEKSPDHRASITITTTGPCVATDGEDSDEVRTLEGRK